MLKALSLVCLKVDPSIWILTTPGAREGEVRTIGVVGAHIDDFLMVGDENNSRRCQIALIPLGGTSFDSLWRDDVTRSSWSLASQSGGILRGHHPSCGRWQR